MNGSIQTSTGRVSVDILFLDLSSKVSSHNMFDTGLVFIFQASFWRRQWILSVPQGVFSQPENKEVDQSWMGNNQEADGEASTVGLITILLQEEDINISVQQSRVFWYHPGAPLHFLWRSGRLYGRRGKRCVCCSRERFLTCPTAKTFQMKSPWDST